MHESFFCRRFLPLVFLAALLCVPQVAGAGGPRFGVDDGGEVVLAKRLRKAGARITKTERSFARWALKGRISNAQKLALIAELEDLRSYVHPVAD
jgi:hypothetical protein